MHLKSFNNICTDKNHALILYVIIILFMNVRLFSPIYLCHENKFSILNEFFNEIPYFKCMLELTYYNVACPICSYDDVSCVCSIYRL